jgi:hypothetical protein
MKRISDRPERIERQLRKQVRHARSRKRQGQPVLKGLMVGTYEVGISGGNVMRGGHDAELLNAESYRLPSLTA